MYDTPFGDDAQVCFINVLSGSVVNGGTRESLWVEGETDRWRLYHNVIAFDGPIIKLFFYKESSRNVFLAAEMTKISIT